MNAKPLGGVVRHYRNELRSLFGSSLILLIWSAGLPHLALGYDYNSVPKGPTTTPPAAPSSAGPGRQFEVGRSGTRQGNGPMTNKVDKAKVGSLFDRANKKASSGDSSGSVKTESATASGNGNGNGKKRTPVARIPNKVPPKAPPAAPPGEEPKVRENTLPLVPTELPKDQEYEVRPAVPLPKEDAMPTLKVGDVQIGPQNPVGFEKPPIYQKTPEREKQELPTETKLPETGIPGRDGIGGINGGFQGELKRVGRGDLTENYGEDVYERGMPGGYNPATDPSGAMGDIGGYLGTAGQAVGGKTGKTMENVGTIMQSQNLGQAAGASANMLAPGTGDFIEAAVNGDRGAMVGAAGTAAGGLVSDLVIGLIIGAVGGGFIGVLVVMVLSATGASAAISGAVKDVVVGGAEKAGITEPTPPPEPAPTPGSYDENHSKNKGKKGPSVVNENHVRPIQEKLQEDLLGENRDADAPVDTSDAPPPSKIVIDMGCDPEGLGGKVYGTIKDGPLTVKDMELGFEKAAPK